MPIGLSYIRALFCASPNNNGPLQIRRKIKVQHSVGLAVQQEGLLLVQCGRKENVDFKRFEACLTVREKIPFSSYAAFTWIFNEMAPPVVHQFQQNPSIQLFIERKRKKTPGSPHPQQRRATFQLCVRLSVTMNTSTGAASGTPPELQDLAEATFWNVSIPRRVKNPLQTALLLNSRSQKLQTGPNNPRQEGHKAGFVAARMQSGLLADMRPERIFQSSRYHDNGQRNIVTRLQIPLAKLIKQIGTRYKICKWWTQPETQEGRLISHAAFSACFTPLPRTWISWSSERGLRISKKIIRFMWRG